MAGRAMQVRDSRVVNSAGFASEDNLEKIIKIALDRARRFEIVSKSSRQNTAQQVRGPQRCCDSRSKRPAQADAGKDL